jgi:chromosome segregation ATPase
MIRLDDFLKVKRKWKSALDNFVKVKMQYTLRKSKNNSMQLVQVDHSTSSNLRHEIELVTQRLGKVKAAMQAGEAIVIQESRQAEQLAANLKTDIAMLRANLKEAEEAFAIRDLARQKIEESLNAKIKSFQEEITKKEALLVTRENEITGYKLKIRKTEEEEASNAKCAEDLAQKTLAKVTVLEAKLKATEELANYQESSIQELKNELGAKAQEFDRIVKDKQELLMRQDSEINDLKSQLKRLTTGISEMSSFFRQAGALNDIEAQAQNDTTAGVEEKVAAVQTHISTTHIASAAVGEIAAPEIFERIITEFSEATNMIDTLATLIVQQQVKALGESVETFPRTRLSELIECLVKDIEDEKRQIDFRQLASLPPVAEPFPAR